MAPPVALARKLITLVHKGLGSKVEVELDGRGDLLLSSTIDRLVMVEIKVSQAGGQREVIHRIMPVFTTMQTDRAEATGKVMIEVARRVERLLPVMESYVNSDQYDIAV
jgi:hypothetical protein